MQPIHQTTTEYDEICSWCPLPPKLIGKQIFLTAFDAEFTDTMLKFMTDETTVLGLGSGLYKGYTRAEEREKLANRKNSIEEGYHFFIWDKSSKKLIGSCSLGDIDPIARVASFGINIGDRQFRGRGRGTDTIETILSFAFEELDLFSVQLGVYEFNENAIACYEKVGFKRIGRHRQDRYCHGRRWDSILMDILRPEYEELKSKK